MRGRETGGADGEEDVDDVDENSAVPPNCSYAPHHRGTGAEVAFIDAGGDATG